MDNQLSGTLHSNKWNAPNKAERSNSKKEQKKNVTKSKASERIEEVVNDDITDKQRLFIGYYLKCWNATKAYQKAYDCAYSTAMVEGHRLLRNPKIATEIQKTRDEIFAFVCSGNYLK